MKVFKENQTVTRKEGNNASSFNRGELDPMGASASCYNEETVFQIEGTVKLITFEHSKEVYGAYLLKRNGVNIGYVYNDALTLVKEVSKVVSNKELLIKYTNLLNDVKQSIELYGDGGFGRPSGLYDRANVLEMIINDLEIK